MRFNTIIREIAKDNVKIKDIIDGKYQHISYSLFYSNKFKNSDNKEDSYEYNYDKKAKEATIRNFLTYTRK